MSFSTKLLSRRIEDEKRIGVLGEGNNGIFSVPSVEPGWELILICSDGTEDLAEGEQRDWEHVSISTRQGTRTRMPTWKEMQFVKTLCWDGDDTVVQFILNNQIILMCILMYYICGVGRKVSFLH